MVSDDSRHWGARIFADHVLIEMKHNGETGMFGFGWDHGFKAVWKNDDSKQCSTSDGSDADRADLIRLARNSRILVAHGRRDEAATGMSGRLPDCMCL
jgi:hypothetical protein